MSIKIEVEAGTSEDDAMQQEIRACLACLETAGKLHDLRERGLEEVFIQLTGLPMSSYDDMPMLACPLCLQLLCKFGRFRARCHSASYSLQQIYFQNSTTSLDSIDTRHLKYNLIQSQILVLSYSPPKPKTKTTTSKKVKSKLIPTDLLEVAIQNPKEGLVDIKDTKDSTINEESPDNKDVSSDNKDESLDNRDETLMETDSDKSDDDDQKPSDSDSRGPDDENITTQEVKDDKVIVKKKKYKYKKGELMKDSLTEDKRLILDISHIFGNMWKWKMEEEMNIYRMFDRIHKQSLAVEPGESGSCNCETKHKKGMVCVKKELGVLLNYSRRLADIYNAEVEFLNFEEQKREMENRKRSIEFIEAEHKCELCCKIFRFPEIQDRHTALHDASPGDLVCEICRYRFQRHSYLMTHLHTVHAKKLKCRECGVETRTWKAAREHYEYHQDRETFCQLCQVNFPKRRTFLNHLRSVHKAQAAAALCLLCGDWSDGALGLQTHMEKSHKKAAQCESCKGWFVNRATLSTHLQNAGGECESGHSACPICGANFSSEEEMWQHHDEQHIKEFKCAQCSKLYAGLREYKWHIEDKHTIGAAGTALTRRQRKRREKNFVCDVCGKDDFPFFSFLRLHMRTHSEEKPFPCTVCEKGFKARLNLEAHMTTHTDERRYQCPYCPKAFRQYQHRTMHIRTHTKERPYACNTCSKRYTGKSALQEHVNTAHRGLPPRQRVKEKQEL